MTMPLALIFYENLLIGNQLMNRLRDLGYRVTPVADLNGLSEVAAREKPLLLIAEVGAMADRVCAAVRSLRANPATGHLPVLAIQKPTKKRADKKLADSVRAAGVNLVANEAACLSQLPELLEQVLEVS